MIRTREERQADRDWCSQFLDSDDFEDMGHGVVLAVTIGAGMWVIAALLLGWL